KSKSFNSNRADDVYDLIKSSLSKPITDSDVVQKLSEMAAKWVSTRDPTLVDPFLHIADKQTIETLLFGWQKFFNLRQLYLLGLTNKEINVCLGEGLTHSEIHYKCY